MDALATNQPGTSEEVNLSKDDNNTQWQKNLLPVMKRMVIGLTLFFFIATFGQLVYLHLSISNQPDLEISEAFTLLEKNPTYTFEQNIEATEMKSLLSLEAASLAKRHHQANVLLMSRVWVRYLGFVTGMILSLIGGIFILGKLSTPVSEVTTNANVANFSIKSASPGIILAVLGVVLMIMTITVHHQIQGNGCSGLHFSGHEEVCSSWRRGHS